MNNNIFQPARFGKLIFRSLRNNPRVLLQNIFVYVGLPVLFLLGMPFDISLNSRHTFFVLLLNIFVIFSPFIFFYTYNHPKKGLTEAMLPASIFEKYLFMQLFCVVLVPLHVFVLYGGMDFLIALLFPQYFEGSVIGKLFSNQINIDMILMMFLSLQAVFLCNLIFVRRKLLKTFGSFIAINMILLLLIKPIMSILGGYEFSESFSGEITFEIETGYNSNLFGFSDGDHPFLISLKVIRIFILFVLPAALMITSYWMMKTKKY